MEYLASLYRSMQGLQCSSNIQSGGIRPAQTAHVAAPLRSKQLHCHSPFCLSRAGSPCRPQSPPQMCDLHKEGRQVGAQHALRVLSVLRSRERRESGKKKCRRPKLSRSLRHTSFAKALMAPG